MKIIVWGTTLGKVADEAQFLSVHRVITERLPDCKMVFLARPSEFDEERYPNIKRITTARVDKWLPELASANLFIMLGGCFMEAPRQAANCLALLLSAKLFRRPIIGVGTTVFPYRTAWGRSVYRFIFNRLETITARERVALDVFDNLDIKTTVTHFADPRFVLPPAGRAEVDAYLVDHGLDPAVPLIGVSTRHLHDGMPDWVKRSHGYTPEAARSSYEALGKLLDDLSEKGQVVILPMAASTSEEETTADLLRANMTDPTRLKVLRPCQAPQLLGLIRACDMIVASRLGAALFATVTSTPVLAIAYEARMIDHMQRIAQERYAFDWRELSADKLCDAAGQIRVNRDAIREEIKREGAAFAESARKNGDVILRVLEKPKRETGR